MKLENIMTQIKETLDMRYNLKRPYIIAIEGQCGAGKTTLADLLGSNLDAAIIRMDDFFLPAKLRTSERYDEPGGNVHYERFNEEVVNSLKEERPITHQVFDCSTMAYGDTRIIDSKPVIIVEGSYSAHPYFGQYYDLLIYLTIHEDEQLKRIEKRVGAERLTQFVERWIPLEEKYASFHNIPKRADLTLENFEAPIMVEVMDIIEDDFLATFERFEETNRIFYLDQDGSLKEKDEHYIVKWDDARKTQVIEILRYYQDQGGAVVAARSGTSLLGFAGLNGKKMGSQRQYLNLGFIHVGNPHRGQGVGHMLFALISQEALKRGAKKLYIGANPAVSTFHFYQSVGCHLAEEIVAEIYDHEPLDLQLEYELE